MLLSLNGKWLFVVTSAHLYLLLVMLFSQLTVCALKVFSMAITLTLDHLVGWPCYWVPSGAGLLDFLSNHNLGQWYCPLGLRAHNLHPMCIEYYGSMNHQIFISQG